MDNVYYLSSRDVTIRIWDAFLGAETLVDRCMTVFLQWLPPHWQMASLLHSHLVQMWVLEEDSRWPSDTG